VVVIVRVTELADEPLTLTDADGAKAQLAAIGTPLPQAKLTVPLKPLVPVTLRLKVAACPAVTVCELVLAPAAMAKSEPVPLRVTVCGTPDALSVTVNDPLADPPVVGLNTTLIVQEPPGATEGEHVLVCENAEGRLPIVTVTAVAPEFVSVTVFAALCDPTLALKFKFVGDTEMLVVTPVPLSGTVWIPALLVIVSVPVLCA
jgi:hypothetical protein